MRQTSLKDACWSTWSSDPLTVSGEFCAVNSEGSKLGSRADTALEEVLVEAKGWMTPASGPCSLILLIQLFSLGCQLGWPIPFQYCKISTKEAAFEAEEVMFLAA